jgi:hypothetical protein
MKYLLFIAACLWLMACGPEDLGESDSFTASDRQAEQETIATPKPDVPPAPADTIKPLDVQINYPAPITLAGQKIIMKTYLVANHNAQYASIKFPWCLPEAVKFCGTNKHSSTIFVAKYRMLPWTGDWGCHYMWFTFYQNTSAIQSAVLTFTTAFEDCEADYS